MTETMALREWAVLELMGHRRLAGLVTEQEVAGAAFLRLDIPGPDGAMTATQLYSASAVYCLTPTTEELARQFAASHQPEPVTRWDLPQLPTGTDASPPDTPDDEEIVF